MFRAIVITTYGLMLLGFFGFTSQLKPEAVTLPPAVTSAPVQSTPAPTPPAPSRTDPDAAVFNIEQKLINSESDAAAHCLNEWTTRGELNRRMYRHCLEQQQEAIRDLESLIWTHRSHRFYDLSILHCYTEWRKRGVTNPRMVNHCMEQEVEGWKDIEYYRDIYGYDTVEDLAHQGMLRYGSWRMGAYHMKQQLDIE